MIWTLTIALCISLSGCTPALLAGAVIALNYVSKEEEQNRRSIAAERKRNASVSRTQATHKPSESKDQKTPERIIWESEIAYGTFQWDKARRLLKELLEREKLSKSLRCEALIILGAMEYQHGNTNQARNYFLKARKQSRTNEPSREMFPPQMLTFYKSVR